MALLATGYKKATKNRDMRRYERQRRRKYRKEEWHFVVCLATLSTCTLRKILGKWMTLEKKTGFLEWQFTGETTKSAFSTDILCTTNHTCRQLAFWDCGFESHRMHGCLSILLCVVKLKSLWRADHSPRGVLPTVVRRCVWSRNLVNEKTLAHWGLSDEKQTYISYFPYHFE